MFFELVVMVIFTHGGHEALGIIAPTLRKANG